MTLSLITLLLSVEFLTFDPAHSAAVDSMLAAVAADVAHLAESWSDVDPFDGSSWDYKNKMYKMLLFALEWISVFFSIIKPVMHDDKVENPPQQTQIVCIFLFFYFLLLKIDFYLLSLRCSLELTQPAHYNDDGRHEKKLLLTRRIYSTHQQQQRVSNTCEKSQQNCSLILLGVVLLLLRMVAMMTMTIVWLFRKYLLNTDIQ